MTDQRFDNFHLHVMQDLLPVGLGMYARVKKVGLKKLLENVNAENLPISELRSEGEPLASSIRDQLDNIKPGLGNPAISVDVNADESDTFEKLDDRETLIITLRNIEQRLNSLSDLLDKQSTSA